MKKSLIFLILGLIIAVVVLVLWWRLNKFSSGIISPLSSFKRKVELIQKPLEKYEFEKLKARGGEGSEIKLEKVLKEEEKFTGNLFSYHSQGRRITGLLNLPKTKAKLPVVVMLRGYVAQEIYQTGVGTQRAGEVFSQNGFITLAPDFLGYGESDMPPNNVWEERFLRLVSVMDLLASVKNLPQANPEKIFLWGHSNGSLIALSVLEISGENYPTTLWAPVSQFFPYDILYYIYEFDDRGKALRKNLADFEKDYDTDKYSFDKYLDWIKAPLLIHQGLGDEYIPFSWTQDLVNKLKNLDKNIVFYSYPGADHNLKGSWETVVQRDINFFKNQSNKIIKIKTKWQKRQLK